MSKRILNLQTFFVCLFLIAVALSACTQSSGKAALTPTSKAGAAARVQQATSQPGCTVVSQAATPDPTQQSILPLPNDMDWSKGPASAPVTIIEYGDFL